MYIYVFMCTCVYIHMCMYVCMYICMYVCMYVCNTYIYICVYAELYSQHMKIGILLMPTQGTMS